MNRAKSFIQRHPVSIYFVMVFMISWIGAFLVVASKLIHGEPILQKDGLLMFPVMLVGPSLTGIILTGIVDGKSGIRNLFSRMGRWRIDMHWYTVLIIPPILIIVVLLTLRTLLSTAFTPSLFLLGILYGLVPGFLEEIGWMGYAFPKMQMKMKRSAFSTGLFLGILWGLWHLPVIDFLGAAYPHGKYWLFHACAFVAAMTAMRILIVWTYSNTRSVLLAQLLHVCSTGSLVVLSPSPILPAQEALWYSIYAVILWIVVAIVTATFGKRFIRNQME